MARLSDSDKLNKTNKARELYIKQFSLVFIADIVGIKVETIKAWAVKYNWDAMKQASAITPDSIKQMILKCAEDIRDGKKPNASPDQLAKLAAAYDKVNDKEKNLAYLLDISNRIVDKIMQKAQQAKKQDKETYLSLAKNLISITDELIHDAQQNIKNE